MISIKTLFIFITFLALIQSYYRGGLVKGRSISSNEEDEDLELERQIKILNKTPIKTFETAEGHKIDCVDIYKQPAFDHPALKNHKIQLRPSQVDSHPHKSSSKRRVESLLQTVDCPEGTVPIRRTIKEDLIRIKSFTKSYPVSVASANHQNIAGVAGHHLAVVSTSLYGQRYYGITGELNAQNPIADRDQSSSSQFWIESGHSLGFNSLQAGWIVSPSLYNDTGTHLFGFWQGEGSSGCFDVTCLGFIQTDRTHFIGELINPTSFYGDPNEYRVPMRLYQDNHTLNWWLSVTPHEFHIGYWPNELIPSLSVGTTTMSWGGAARPNRGGQGPQMGNGHFPAGSSDFDHACFISHMKVYTVDRFWEDPTRKRLDTFVDQPECYDLEYYGRLDSNYEHVLQFGGPGGNCGPREKIVDLN